MPQCKNCSKQFFCDKKNCTFVSWIYTKNYGEVTRIDAEQLKNKNSYDIINSMKFWRKSL